jgi:aminoglycoside 3-N-acetyltransferase I
MLDPYAVTFEDDAYVPDWPSSRGYFRRHLESESFGVLAALHGARAIGGLAACELMILEQECSEFCIHDLAVEEDHWLKGVATALIGALKPIARASGARVIFIQGRGRWHSQLPSTPWFDDEWIRHSQSPRPRRWTRAPT